MTQRCVHRPVLLSSVRSVSQPDTRSQALRHAVESAEAKDRNILDFINKVCVCVAKAVVSSVTESSCHPFLSLTGMSYTVSQTVMSLVAVRSNQITVLQTERMCEYVRAHGCACLYEHVHKCTHLWITCLCPHKCVYITSHVWMCGV